MARIRAMSTGTGTRVLVTGRLTAADMGRFEHACAPALTRAAASLEIDLRGMTESDRTAQALIERMMKRGARVNFR